MLGGYARAMRLWVRSGEVLSRAIINNTIVCFGPSPTAQPQIAEESDSTRLGSAAQGLEVLYIVTYYPVPFN